MQRRCVRVRDPSTLNPQPSTLNSQPSTPTPHTLNPHTLNPQPRTRFAEWRPDVQLVVMTASCDIADMAMVQPHTFHPQPSALNPVPCTLNPEP